MTAYLQAMEAHAKLGIDMAKDIAAYSLHE